MKKYSAFNTFYTQPGKADELVSILLQAATEMSHVAGSELYIVNKDSNQADCVRVFEIWTSKADHDISLQDPLARELINQALPLLTGRPESVEMEVIS
jgi:quinol monooxygenase YgiN